MVNPIIEEFLNNKRGNRKSENTIKNYEIDLYQLFDYLKVRKNVNEITIETLKKVNHQDLMGFLANIKGRDSKQSSANTQKRKRATICSFWNYLVNKAEYLDNNVAEKLDKIKDEERKIKYLNNNQVRELINTINISNASDDEFVLRDKAIISLFLACGLRKSELSSLNLNNIQNNLITVIGKGNKERSIPVSPKAMESINKYLKVRPRDCGEALFISNKKCRLTPKAVGDVVKKYFEKAGIDTNKFSTHTLRHTFATLTYKSGQVGLAELQELLGHSSPETTRIYTQIDTEQLRKAASFNPLEQIS